MLQMKVFDSIEQISSSEWDALHKGDFPFIEHAFLAALERHGCVSSRFGWIPRHLGFYDESQRLVAAMPLYEKHNNYGEFVFDHAWQEAWQSIGLPYYPKFVSAIPYTPARGPRVLLADSIANRPVILQQILEHLKQFAHLAGVSGVHILFDEAQTALAEDREILVRNDVQFQWFNQNYQTFEDFLASLKPKKRKNIRQERRAIVEMGITFEVLNGEQASEQDWLEFDYFYQKTFIEKWSTPTLNVCFFKEVAAKMPKKVVLVLAKKGAMTIAGALMFRSEKVLYGRHWGCGEQIKHLHFETCFYQGIEYAIQQGIQRFEPGAGGEHKISRGFVPVPMQSSHWLTVNPFVQPIERFIEQEALMIQAYQKEVWESVPYQQTEPLKLLAQQSARCV